MARLEILQPKELPPKSLNVKPSVPDIQEEMKALKEKLFVQKQKEIQIFLDTATDEKKEMLIEGAEGVIDSAMMKYYTIMNSGNYSRVEKEEYLQDIVIDIQNAQEVIFKKQDLLKIPNSLGITAPLREHRYKKCHPDKETPPEDGLIVFVEDFIADRYQRRTA